MAHDPQSNARPGPALVVGIGNPLRRDDGFGPIVAEAVARLGWDGVEAIAVHQLLPELAEPIASARLVLFVDARVDADGAGIDVSPVEPGPAVGPIGHVGDPARLLALAREVFGSCPPAWLLTAPASDLSLGEGLSAEAGRALHDAIDRLAALLTRGGIAPDRGDGAAPDRRDP